MGTMEQAIKPQMHDAMIALRDMYVMADMEIQNQNRAQKVKYVHNLSSFLAQKAELLMWEHQT